jgi:HK97 family phage prohead protease
MPEPGASESREDFLQRCMSDPEAREDFPDDDQRYAFCLSQWERRAVKPQEKVLELLRSRTKRRAEFGYGITTADQYLRRAIAEAGRAVTHRTFEIGNPEEAIQKAADRLVYANPDMVAEKRAASRASFKELLPEGVDAPAHTQMVFRHTITTPREDRDKDILETGGAMLDPKAPLLWQHINDLPIGAVLAEVEHTKKILRAVTALLDLNELTEDAAKLIEADVLRFSHGFRVLDFEERKAEEDSPWGGLLIKRFEIMEVSLVSVPSNIDAELEMFARGKLASDYFRAHAKHFLEERKKAQAPGITLPNGGDTQLTLKLGGAEIQLKTTGGGVVLPAHVQEDPPEKPAKESGSEPGRKIPAQAKAEEDPLRWSKGLSKRFDIELEHLEPSNLEYDWVSRFCSCEVKHIYQAGFTIPSFRMGSWLSGLDEIAGSRGFEIVDTRNITRDGKEVPPGHEVIQLNSKQRQSFLVDGLQFVQADGWKTVIKRSPVYHGLWLTFYTSLDHGAKAQELESACWKWAIENNYLKGERFSLSGDFIPAPTVDFSDLFLDSANQKAVERVAKTINGKGAQAPNRGLIFMGPPGTGKTLSGRILSGEANATFIWLSSRDFYYSGAFGGFTRGFDLARELAPSILFIEDVDNWMSERACDLLKTELDGLAQSSGVTTILTTNYPERLPNALIDRPGRFHDVCNFALPDKAIRQAMLSRWYFGNDAKVAAEAAGKTEGWSGAHIFELCQYARSLVEEDEGLAYKDAIDQALAKIEEQRTLIDEAQLAGSNYKPSAKLAEALVLKKAQAFESTPKGGEGDWDAKAATKRLRSWAGVDQDDPPASSWSKFARGFGRVTGKGSQLEDFSYPHHDIEDGKLVLSAKGLGAAVAAVNGARGESDWDEQERKAVYQHLAKHYRKDLEKDPPPFRSSESAEWSLKDEEAGKVYAAHTLPELMADLPAEKLTEISDWFGSKVGRVLSQRNVNALSDTIEDLKELQDAEELKRSQKALVGRCVTRLEAVLKAAKPADDEEEDSGKSIQEMSSALLALADLKTLASLKEAIEGILEVDRLDKEAAQLRRILS